MKYQVIYKQPKNKGFITHKAVFYKIEDAIMWEQYVEKQECKEIKIVPV
jgi:hypothetical protein